MVAVGGVSSFCYGAFMKTEDIQSLNGKAYFRWWSMALKALLGWSDERIEKWADKYADCVQRENDLLYHMLPGNQVIAEYLDEKHPGWRGKLEERDLFSANTMREISDCINEFIHPKLEHRKKWDAAKDRIEGVVKRLGL